MISEQDLHARLRKAGFTPTEFIDGDLRIWSYKSKPYIIPQTIAENSEQGFFSEETIERFFKNVYLEEALDNPMDGRNYNVTKLPLSH